MNPGTIIAMSAAYQDIEQLLKDSGDRFFGDLVRSLQIYLNLFDALAGVG